MDPRQFFYRFYIVNEAIDSGRRSSAAKKESRIGKILKQNEELKDTGIERSSSDNRPAIDWRAGCKS